MEEFLPQLLAFPPNPLPPRGLSNGEIDRQLIAQIQLISQINESKLIEGITGDADLLDVLDPSTNTIPFLCTLLARIRHVQNSKKAAPETTASFAPGNFLWEKAVEFINHFDPVQVRYVGHDLRRLIETFTRVADITSNPLLVIPIVRTVILRVDPSSSCFTSTHTVFIRLCLRAKAYTEALDVLDKDILHFPTNGEKMYNLPLLCGHHETSATYITSTSQLSADLNYRDHLLYFLYGGMIYIGLKNWERALLFLEIVVMSPTENTASMIQVEAYKKSVLTSLIATGKPPTLPRTTNTQASKHYHAIARPYDAVAEMFVAGKADKFRAEVEAGQEIWHNDCNTGILFEVAFAFQKFQILNLGKTFIALSVADVIRHTSSPSTVPEMEQYVHSLITSGLLNASLVPASGPQSSSVLRFSTSSRTGPLSRSELQQFEELKQQTIKTTELANHIKAADKLFELSAPYLEWARKMKKAAKNGELDGGFTGMIPTPMGDDIYAIDDPEDMLAEM